MPESMSFRIFLVSGEICAITSSFHASGNTRHRFQCGTAVVRPLSFGRVTHPLRRPIYNRSWQRFLSILRRPPIFQPRWTHGQYWRAWFARAAEGTCVSLGQNRQMPFANLSGDTAEDYFADGIVDNLT